MSPPRSRTAGASSGSMRRRSRPTWTPRATLTPSSSPPPNVTGQLHIGHALKPDFAGHLVPPRAAAGQEGPLGCRAWTMRASPPRTWSSASSPPRAARARTWPREVRGRGLGMEGGVRRQDPQPDPAHGRVRGLDARALHHGRGPLARRAPGLRAPCSRKASSTRATTSSTGATAATPPWPTTRSSAPRTRAISTTSDTPCPTARAS